MVKYTITAQVGLSPGIIFLRRSCTQDLIQSSVYTSASSVVLSSALVQEQSDVLQGSCSGLHMTQETLTQRGKSDGCQL